MPHEWQTLYPFESRELRIDGHRYHYVDEGSGPPVLLVHGNPTWSFYWRNVILGLRDSYRVIAVDHLGCGLCDKPQRYDYCLERHIENLRQLVVQLDLQNATLVGHDWGGAIGIGMALREPARFERFIMFNTAAFTSNRMPWRIAACRIPVLGTVAVRGLNAFLRAAFWMATNRRERFTQDVRAGYAAPYDSWANRIAIDRFVKDIPLRPSHRSYQTLLQIEKGLPTLADRPWQFIWGMRDWCFSPPFLDRFLEFFPHAEVHRIACAGHWVVEDAADEILPLVRKFLVPHT